MVKLVDSDMPGFLVGTGNQLYINRPKRIAVVANVDEGTVDCLEPRLKPLLMLSRTEHAFIDNIVRVVEETWDSEMNADAAWDDSVEYQGSDAWIRSQFQEYTLALLSTVVKIPGLQSNPDNRLEMGPDELNLDGCGDFNKSWVKTWMRTTNYQKWLMRCNFDSAQQKEYKLSAVAPRNMSSFLRSMGTGLKTAVMEKVQETNSLDLEMLGNNLFKQAQQVGEELFSNRPATQEEINTMLLDEVGDIGLARTRRIASLVQDGGAQLNCRDNRQWTPLMRAAFFNQVN